MAGTYELGVATVAAAAAAGYCTIHTGATRRCKIWEIGMFTSAGTLSSVGLGTPANTPVATTSVLGAALTPNDPASTVNVDTAWSTAPTVPAKFIRQIVLPATAGSGFIWVFQRPLILAVSSWLVLWNFGGAAGAILDGYFSWDEE